MYAGGYVGSYGGVYNGYSPPAGLPSPPMSVPSPHSQVHGQVKKSTMMMDNRVPVMNSHPQNHNQSVSAERRFFSNDNGYVRAYTTVVTLTDLVFSTSYRYSIIFYFLIVKETDRRHERRSTLCAYDCTEKHGCDLPEEI